MEETRMEGLASNGGYRAFIWSFIFFAIQALLCSLSKHDNISLTLFQVHRVSLLIIILIKPKCEVTHEE